MNKMEEIGEMMEETALKGLREILKSGSEDQKENLKLNFMEHRSTTLVEIFLKAFTEGVVKMEMDHAYKFQTEDNVEYVMVPLPLPVGVFDKFKEEVDKQCGSCKGSEFCLRFEKSLEASLMKGLLMELIHSQASLVKMKLLSKILK